MRHIWRDLHSNTNQGKLLGKIYSAKICPGNEDFAQLAGIKQVFKGKDGETIAHVDSYGTIRYNKCEWGYGGWNSLWSLQNLPNYTLNERRKNATTPKASTRNDMLSLRSILQKCANLQQEDCVNSLAQLI